MRVLYLPLDSSHDFPASRELEGHRLDLFRCSSLAEAVVFLQQQDVDVILVRTASAGEAERECALCELLCCAPLSPVILWSRSGKTTDAVRASRLGAYQFITDDLAGEELPRCLLAAVLHKRAQEAVYASQPAAEPWRAFLVGESLAMKTIYQIIRLISPRRCTALITGETGTGKEMVARSLHQASPRANAPLVAVNCSALPAELLEAELFGHVKGAFTGAFANRIGRFEQAHRGTIFLDEVSEIPLPLQAKLLRVLQEFEFQRLGSSETVKVDVRVIAASNTNLVDRVRDGLFREDLYYRLNVAPVYVPPLRKRIEDIPLLVHHFVHKICRAEQMPLKSVSPEALRRMQDYSWPGNVRQLENMVSMAIAMSGDRTMLQLSDFPTLFAGSFTGNHFAVVHDEGLDYNLAVDEFERNILEQALRLTNGNKKSAAALLKLKRSTFAAKLRSLNVAIGQSQGVDAEDDAELAGVSGKDFQQDGLELVGHLN